MIIPTRLIRLDWMADRDILVAFGRSDKILVHFPSWLVDSRLTSGLPRQWMQSTPYYDRASLTSSL